MTRAHCSILHACRQTIGSHFSTIVLRTLLAKSYICGCETMVSGWGLEQRRRITSPVSKIKNSKKRCQKRAEAKRKDLPTIVGRGFNNNNNNRSKL